MASNSNAKAPDVVYDFCNDILKVMNQNKIGLQESTGIPCLPDGERERLVTEANICKTLEPVDSHLVQWIKEKASRTFVITILAISETAKRREAMETFMIHGFQDNNLPVKDLPKICVHDWYSACRNICSCQFDAHEPRICDAVHDDQLDCFHHGVWSLNAFEIFYQKQWRLLLQTFDSDTFEYPEIDHDRILPFLPSKKRSGTKGGNFAEVRPARMLKNFKNTVDNVCYYSAAYVANVI